MPHRSREQAKPTSKPDAHPTKPSLVGAAHSKTESAVEQPNSPDTVGATPHDKVETLSTAEGPSPSESRKTWYGGTWPRTPNSSRAIQVAEESSLTGGRHVVPKSTKPLRKPSLYLSPNMGSRPLPLAATTTKVNIDSRNRDISLDEQLGGTGSGPDGAVENLKQGDGDEKDTKKDRPRRSSADILNAEDKQGVAEGIKGASPGWLGWFARPVEPQEAADQVPQQDFAVEEVAPSKTVQGESPGKHSVSSIEASDKRRNSDPSPISAMPNQDRASRSTWLGFWGTSAQTSDSKPGANEAGTTQKAGHIEPEGNLIEATTASMTAPHPVSDQPTTAEKPSGWAFWSRNHSEARGTSGGDNSADKVAVAGLPSHPEVGNATINQVTVSSTKEKSEKTRPTEPSAELQQPSTSKHNDDRANISTEAHIVKNIDAARPPVSKQSTVNLLLPSFASTYRMAEKPTLLQQLGRMIRYTNADSQSKHVNLLPNPPIVQKALAIGVHGYFPAPLIRSVLGQPTGTSMRFANGAANAIQAWTAHQGYSCEIEKVALEGEGKIAERVDLLWKLLFNWMEKIRRADVVIVACHSQGVPVAIMLLAKLIAFGCVNGARIGVCAMAGVNLGPFGDYKSRWISGSAGELFDFAEATSNVSRDYEVALSTVLRFGVKVLYAGSIDDQLVSLESSTFGTVIHPCIFRAVFVDGRLHTPNFLSHLVGFALKLRNLGISDHGLIRELSTPLAGSLYSGEGHSRIYDDNAVYYLAVQHALETTSVGDVPIQRLRYEPAGTSQNPYILPFAMRGLLEEDYVRTELFEEMKQLLEQFEAWKPSSKVLKDVRYRLQGIRSML